MTDPYKEKQPLLPEKQLIWLKYRQLAFEIIEFQHSGHINKKIPFTM